MKRRELRFVVQDGAASCYLVEVGQWGEDGVKVDAITAVKDYLHRYFQTAERNPDLTAEDVHDYTLDRWYRELTEKKTEEETGDRESFIHPTDPRQDRYATVRIKRLVRGEPFTQDIHLKPGEYMGVEADHCKLYIERNLYCTPIMPENMPSR